MKNHQISLISCIVESICHDVLNPITAIINCNELLTLDLRNLDSLENFSEDKVKNIRNQSLEIILNKIDLARCCYSQESSELFDLNGPRNFLSILNAHLSFSNFSLRVNFSSHDCLKIFMGIVSYIINLALLISHFITEISSIELFKAHGALFGFRFKYKDYGAMEKLVATIDSLDWNKLYVGNIHYYYFKFILKKNFRKIILEISDDKFATILVR